MLYILQKDEDALQHCNKVMYFHFSQAESAGGSGLIFFCDEGQLLLDVQLDLVYDLKELRIQRPTNAVRHIFSLKKRPGTQVTRTGARQGDTMSAGYSKMSVVRSSGILHVIRCSCAFL